MSEDTKKQNKSCGGCSHCAVEDKTPEVGELAGWRLVMSAAGMFLLPLVSALAGAIIGGSSEVKQFIGGVSGLSIGAVVAILTAGILRKSRRETI